MRFTILFNLAAAAVVNSLPAQQDNVNMTMRHANCITTGWATFYEDKYCKHGPSMDVSAGNDGCLANMRGKKSVYLQPPCTYGMVAPGWHEELLKFYPGDNCKGCAQQCINVPFDRLNGQNNCWELPVPLTDEFDFPDPGSFRFVKWDGCPNDC